MTSRRYSETDIARHLSAVEEEEENTGSFNENQGTPRSIYVPNKKPRISDSPLTSIQQSSMEQSKTDKCNMSIFGNSRILEEEIQCKCQKFKEVLTQYKTLQERIQNHFKSKHPNFSQMELNATNSFRGASQISFMEEEMQVMAEETCKCEQNFDEEKQHAQDQINYLQKQFESMQLRNKNEEEFSQLKAKLLKEQTEAQEHKNLAEKIQKEAESLQIALATEKKSSNERICELAKEKKFEIEALMAEMEKLKEEAKKTSSQLKTDNELLQGEKNYLQSLVDLHETESADFKKVSEMADKLKEEFLQLDSQLSDGKKENELVKKEADEAQAKVKQLQEILDSEKENAEIHLQKLQQQTKNENDALKTALNNIKLMEEQISVLNEKIQDFEQQEVENQKAFDKIEAENKILQNEKAKFGRLCKSKDDEIDELKKTVATEKRERLDQVLQLFDQLSKASDEMDALKEKLQICGQKEAESKKAYEKMKAEMEVIGNEKVDLKYVCAAKDVKINQLMDQKQKFENNAIELLKQLSEANEEFERFQTTLNTGKEKSMELKGLLKQKDEEIITLKIQIEAHKAVEGKTDSKDDEIEKLKKQLSYYKKKDTESEEICNYLKTDIEILQEKEANLEKICATKDGEINDLKETAKKEKIELKKQVSKLNDQYLKAESDIEEYKSVTIPTLQALIEKERKDFNLRIAEIEKQKMEEILAIKATFGDTTKQQILELENNAGPRDETAAITEDLDDYDFEPLEPEEEDKAPDDGKSSALKDLHPENSNDKNIESSDSDEQSSTTEDEVTSSTENGDEEEMEVEIVPDSEANALLRNEDDAYYSDGDPAEQQEIEGIVPDSEALDSSNITKNFEFIFQKRGTKNVKYLRVYTNEERTMFYSFIKEYRPTYYRCSKCMNAFKHTVSVTIIKNANGEECVNLGSKDHLCKPQELQEKVVIKSPYYQISNERSNRKIVRYLYVFVGEDLCRRYTWKERSKQYVCSTCSKKCVHVTVQLIKKNNEEWVELGAREHICDLRPIPDYLTRDL